VPIPGGGQGTVETDNRFRRGKAEHFPGQEGDPGDPGGMGTGGPYHYRTENFEQGHIFLGHKRSLIDYYTPEAILLLPLAFQFSILEETSLC
jgi:hypothetical protein